MMESIIVFVGLIVLLKIDVELNWKITKQKKLQLSYYNHKFMALWLLGMLVLMIFLYTMFKVKLINALLGMQLGSVIDKWLYLRKIKNGLE